MLCPFTRAEGGSRPIRQMFQLKTGVGQIPHPQVILNGWEAWLALVNQVSDTQPEELSASGEAAILHRAARETFLRRKI